MPLEAHSPRFHEFGIADPTADEADFLVHTCGPRCHDILGDLFACYLRNEGDVSDWDDRALFGRFIAEHSSIPPREVAVYLGFPSAMAMFDEAPTYEIESEVIGLRFDGIDGDPRMLLRIAFDSATDREFGCVDADAVDLLE